MSTSGSTRALGGFPRLLCPQTEERTELHLRVMSAGAGRGAGGRCSPRLAAGLLPRGEGADRAVTWCPWDRGDFRGQAGGWSQSALEMCYFGTSSGLESAEMKRPLHLPGGVAGPTLEAGACTLPRLQLQRLPGPEPFACFLHLFILESHTCRRALTLRQQSRHRVYPPGAHGLEGRHRSKPKPAPQSKCWAGLPTGGAAPVA